MPDKSKNLTPGRESCCKTALYGATRFLCLETINQRLTLSASVTKRVFLPQLSLPRVIFTFTQSAVSRDKS